MSRVSNAPEAALRTELLEWQLGLPKAAIGGVMIDESLRDLGVSDFRGANRIKGAFGRFHDLIEKG